MFEANLFGSPERHIASAYKGVTTQSLYITMRDGVKIALDLILPQGTAQGTKLPTIVIPTRYWRSMKLWLPSPPGKSPQAHRGPVADFFGEHGYAVVVVDARGSGASFGTWLYPWTPTEIADNGEVVTWIVQQSWSNGQVGAMGISYEGTAAQHFATINHPAVKAVIPQMIEFDVFTDLVFPGGIFCDWFTKAWNENNLSLDHGNLPSSVVWYLRLLVRGVRPVDEDKDNSQLKAALASHLHNREVYQTFKSITYRDDPYSDLSITIDDFSLFSYREKIERSKVAIFGWGSWLDAATADTVIRRFINFSNPQCAVIGAWSHTAEHHGSPYCPPKTAPVPPLEAQWQESLRFLNHYLNGTTEELLSHKVLFYFTLGEEKWKATSVWPPAGTTSQRWYLTENHLLFQQSPTTETGADSYTVDFEATSGSTNRWHTEMGEPVIYPDRAKADRRLLAYTSPPLLKDMEITGYPIVTLYVTSTATDGAFFVYLEEIDETGKVIYITEGQLRAIHRKISTETPPYKLLVPYHSFKKKDSSPLIPGEIAELTFGLLPTSVLIKKGHRLRVAIAGHDKDTFAQIPTDQVPTITVARNKLYASFIDLPVLT